MLRNVIRQNILKPITDSNLFSTDDFNISFDSSDQENADDKYLVKIVFQHDEPFYLKVIQNKRYETNQFKQSIAINPFAQTEYVKDLVSSYDVLVYPGKELVLETWPIRELSDIPEQVEKWLNYLNDELSVTAPESSNQNVKKQKIKEALKGSLGQYVDDKDSRFNEDQVLEISEKMDQLVVAIDETKLLIKGEIEQLKQLIEQINSNLTKYKKGTWYEVTSNRLAEWAQGIKHIDTIISSIQKISDHISSSTQ